MTTTEVKLFNRWCVPRARNAAGGSGRHARADWASLGCSVSRFVGAGSGEAAGDGQPLAELTGSCVRRTFDDVEVADISLEDYIAVKVRATAR